METQTEMLGVSELYLALGNLLRIFNLGDSFNELALILIKTELANRVCDSGPVEIRDNQIQDWNQFQDFSCPVGNRLLVLYATVGIIFRKSAEFRWYSRWECIQAW